MESKILYTILLVLILFLLLIEYKRLSNKENFININDIKGKNVQAIVISELFSEKDSLTMEELREKIMSKVDKYFIIFKLFHGKDTVTKQDIEKYLQ